MLWIGVADRGFSALGGIVAIHTADQAVFAVAFTVQHRGIALMQQQIHMLTAHDFDRLDAGAGTAWFVRLRDDDCTEARTVNLAGGSLGNSQAAEQAAEQQADQQERQGFRTIDHWLQ
jgi:hypothetical protein